MSDRLKNVIFVGDLNTYGRSFQRSRIFKTLFPETVCETHTPVSQEKKILPPTLFYRISVKLGFPLDQTGVNASLEKLTRERKVDLVWIEKGNTIHPSLLKKIKKRSPQTALVSFSEDDMFVKHGHSNWYKSGLKYYDCVFTTKLYNLNELLSFGAKRTELILDSFDEETHRPIELSKSERQRFACDVSAIGAFEIERAKSLLFLAQNGVTVHVWGNGWSGWTHKHPNLVVKNEFLFGLEYAKAIAGTKVNLNFLRKINRDEVTSRSVEIPACRGFMLSERTARHLDFFEEGKEAEFFDSDQELLDKIKHYLKNDEKRNAVALAGRERCIASGYSTKEQIKIALSKI